MKLFQQHERHIKVCVYYSLIIQLVCFVIITVRFLTLTVVQTSITC